MKCLVGYAALFRICSSAAVIDGQNEFVFERIYGNAFSEFIFEDDNCFFYEIQNGKHVNICTHFLLPLAIRLYTVHQQISSKIVARIK